MAKESNTGVRPDLYAATPPSECLRLLLSELATDKTLKLMYADVSRAYFYAKAIRPVYVQLTEEDLEDGDEGKCGKLLMSMYGTRDAALNWSAEYTQTLVADGYERGKANPCLFKHPVTKVMIMVHGDDFVAVGHDKNLKSARSTLEDKYAIKVDTLGNGKDCVSEVKILNKIVKHTGDGIELEADPRHAEIVVRELGLENAKISRVPGVKIPGPKKDKDDEHTMERVQVLHEELMDEVEVDCDDPLWTMDDGADESEEEDSDENQPLDAEGSRQYRAITARLNYLAADRVDIQYAVKEAARGMSSPTKAGWSLLGKIGRYLKGKPRLVMKFPWQVRQSLVTSYTDSDWAGCRRTAKSTSGGILTLGSHVIKSYSRQQKVIALSSAEAELYAMVAASAETLAIIAYAADLGISLGGEVYADSSAALGISQRIGIGKVRHLRTQGLWVQETRISGRLAYHKVLGTKNPADVLTKHVPGELLERHLETLGAEMRGGRAELAPELMSLATSWVQWYKPLEAEEETNNKTRKVTFAKKVQFRAVEHRNKGRSCKD